MNSRKPVIALTPYFNQERKEPYMRPAYLKAIQAAGGIPVILPVSLEGTDLAQLLETVDGVLFTGGPDVHPFYFGEETQAHCGNVCLERDRMELTLLKLAMAARKPVLGICRGVQLLNIGLGGDIYQDIPSQFPENFPIAHSQPFDYVIPSHTVEVVPGTLLAEIAGEAAGMDDGSAATGGSAVTGGNAVTGSSAATGSSSRLQVNSMHHQAVRRVAPGLVASAYAPNQLVEAIEKPDYPFFLGVQWHPEYLWERDPVAAGIFARFIKMAGA